MSDERKALRETVRRFMAAEVLPNLDEWERAASCRASCTRRRGSSACSGSPSRQTVGGGGGSLADAIAVVEEMHYAGGSGGLVASLLTCGIALPHIVAAGNHGQIERWVRPTLDGALIGALAITEPDGGSDVASLRTTARRDGDHFVVNGAKTYITSGCRADFVTTAVRTDGPGAHGISLLVIERARRVRGVPQAREAGLALLGHGRAVVHRRAGAGGEPGGRAGLADSSSWR